jgi:DNA-binding response OmpR family regulator
MSLILLVDDHPPVLRTWADLLRRSGHEVHTAESVVEARNKAGAQPFDLVILDLDLPDGSGQDVFAELQCRANAPRVIAVSELSTAAEVRSYIASGFFRHLSKPVRLAELQPAVEAVELSLPLGSGPPLTLSA